MRSRCGDGLFPRMRHCAGFRLATLAAVLLLSGPRAGWSSCPASPASLPLPDVEKLGQALEQAYSKQEPPVCRPAEDAPTESILVDEMVKRGSDCYIAEDYEAAAEHYRRALDRIVDCTQRTKLLRWYGLAVLELGRYREAMELFDASKKCAEAEDDLLAAFHARFNRAILHSRQGSYGHALKLFREALTDLERAQDNAIQQDDRAKLKARLLAETAELLASLDHGDEEVCNSFEQALRTLAGFDAPDTLVTIYRQYGSALSKLGLNDASLDKSATALKHGLSLEAPDLRGVGKTINNIAFVLAKTGRCDEALDYLRLALMVNRRQADAPGEARTLDSLGRALLCRGDLDEALEHLSLSLAISQSEGVKDRDAQYDTFVHLADVYREKKATQLEIIALKRAIFRIEQTRAELGGLPEEIGRGFDRSLVDTYRRLIDLLFQEGRAAEAIKIIDLMHTELADLGGFEEGTTSPPPTTDEVGLSEVERKFWTQQDDALSSLADVYDRRQSLMRAKQKKGCYTKEALDCADIQQRLSEAQNAIARHEKMLGELKADPIIEKQIDEAKTIAGVLKANEALIYAYLRPERLELLLVTEDGRLFRPDPTVVTSEGIEILRKNAKDFRDLLHKRKGDPRTLGRRLYERLVEPVHNVLHQQGIDTIYFVPDDTLRYVPFAALHDGTDWLVENYDILTVVSGKVALLNREPKPTSLILAAAYTADHHVDGKIFAGLPHAKLEVDDIGKRFADSRINVVIKDTDAFDAKLIKSFHEYEVIHLATHAYLKPGKDPAESYILLGDGHKAKLSEVGDWELSGVNLLVLSACETGFEGDPPTPPTPDDSPGSGDGDANAKHAKDRNHGRDGQELVAFADKVKGAKSVIATLWQVHDGGTQVLMARFYQSLREEENPSPIRALRTAQTCMIRQESECDVTNEDNRTRGHFGMPARDVGDQHFPKYSDPHFWAAFYITGSGRGPIRAPDD